MGLLQGRSPFGAFIRSPFGARGLADDVKYHSDGVATAIAYSAVSIARTKHCVSKRVDDPYLTQSSLQSSTTITDSVGKLIITGGNAIGRFRVGHSFLLASSYPGSTGFKYQFQMGFISQTLELGTISVYISNTDDNGLYGAINPKSAYDWEINNNNLIYNGPFDTALHTTDLNFSFVNAKLNTHLCLLFVSDLEFSGGGLGTHNLTSSLSITASKLLVIK